MKINQSTQAFILNWCEIAAAWGMNRTVAQIHALLLASEDPLTADEIKLLLQVARSNVSVSLRELQNWGLISTSQVMGDRKKRFEAHKDMKTMFKQVMSERKKREVGAALKSLGACTQSTGVLDSKLQKQLEDLTSVFTKLDAFYDQLIKNV